MLNILFTKSSFSLGFWIGIAISITANLLSLIVSRMSYMGRIRVAQDGYSWGFPFTMFLSYDGASFSYNGFIQFGLIANILIAVGFSFFLGLLFRSMSKKK